MPGTVSGSVKTPGYSQVPSPLISSRACADYEGFFAAVEEALSFHMKEQNVPAGREVRFTQEYPKDREGKFDTRFEVIKYHIVGAAPAAADNEGRVIPNGMTTFHNRPHPGMSRYHQRTAGWREDVIVQFDILSKSNLDASQLATWFHRFIMFYAWSVKFFEAHGIQKFRFVQRLEDDTIKEFGQELYRRRLQYGFKLSFLFNFNAKDLESLHVELQNGSSSAPSPVTEYDLRIDGHTRE